ncbi:MAG: transcriptional regulator [Alphaproteobacteria bacterium]|nr:transcriptional regulator [Alphaproteobacteria bacterium]
MADSTNTHMLEMTSDIVSSFVSHNAVASDALPGLIKQVYTTLSDIAEGRDETSPRQAPAVPVEQSITPDHIICLEDGRKLKMLKRYLRSRYDLTPDEYRARWGLPADYPMVAPNYAKKRSAFAKEIGLGRKKS